MNNWGYSKLTRGEFKAAERLFGDAIRQDRTLFTAKNNLVLARGAQRELHPARHSDGPDERAQLLHTLALSAIKQGDVETGKGLLRDAIQTHPQHFEAAVRSLTALEQRVQRLMLAITAYAALWFLSVRAATCAFTPPSPTCAKCGSPTRR